MVTSKTKLNVGVIGYSPLFNMGKNHLQEMARNDGLIPHAVCDLSRDVLGQAELDFPGIKTFLRVEDLLAESDVDLVAIITPHNTHFPLALECLKAGKHVVMEKPFSLSLDECEEMVSEAKRRKLLLSAYHNRHWDGSIRTILRVLPEIGRPFRWESFQGDFKEPGAWWRSSREISGGIHYDWGAHFVEWMLQVLKYPITEISGFQVTEKWRSTTNEDEVEMLVRFGDRAIGTHTASNVAAAGKDAIRITGTEGAVVWNWGNVVLHTTDSEGQKLTKQVRMEESESFRYYENIHAHLLKGEPLVITPQLGMRVVQILDFAGQSARAGHAVRPRVP